MIDEDEVGLKEKPDTSKRLHQNKTRSTGSAGEGLDPKFAIIGTAGASGLKAPSRGVKYPGQVAPTTGSLILVPPQTQG